MTSAGALTLTRHQTNATLSTTALGQVSSSHSYNAFAEPATDTFSAGTTQLYDASYTRDALGRVASKTETIGDTTTTYILHLIGSEMVRKKSARRTSCFG